MSCLLIAFWCSASLVLYLFLCLANISFRTVNTVKTYRWRCVCSLNVFCSCVVKLDPKHAREFKEAWYS